MTKKLSVQNAALSLAKKKNKKRSVTWWKKHLDDKYREWFRKIYFKCCICGRDNIQISHIYSKGAHQALRYDPINTLPMCGGCHKFKWHEDPCHWEWFEKAYPDRYVYLKEAIKVFVKRDQAYWERTEKAIDEKDFRALLIYRLDR
jgi:hypothetical protein